MQVRLSATGRHAFRFLPTNYLRMRGAALWLADQAQPAAIHQRAGWTWGNTPYSRADLKGPLTVEFWNDTDRYPREKLGLFDRLTLAGRGLLHQKFLLAYYDSSLAQWVCAGTGAYSQELHIRAEATASEASRRQHMIEQAAYFNALRRGFLSGREQEDWLRAEADIDARLWFYQNRLRSGSTRSRA